MYISCMCFARQLWIVLTNRMGWGLSGILLSYPFSWLLTLAVAGLYILYLGKESSRHTKSSLSEVTA
ncbi:MAG: hypothetical protein Q4B72_09305 [Lachnospiraceae bacterium]|nr:hypothetical protein [Lachnospiraceae bacterium]